MKRHARTNTTAASRAGRTIAALLAASLTTSAPAQILTGMTRFGEHVRFDLATNTLLSVTPTGLPNIQGSAMLSNGNWWVGANLGRWLVEVDPLTGATGPPRTIPYEGRCLAAHPITGELYGLQADGNLYRYDPVTSTFTFIGDLVSTPGGFQGLAFTQDARLFGWCAFLDPTRNGLWEIDPFTLSAFRRVPDPSGAMYQHQFLSTHVDGGLIAGRTDLWRVDPDTGVATFITALGAELYAADLVETRELGLSFCAAQPNSLGRPAKILAYGSGDVGDNLVRLGCSDLPFHTSGYFLVSRTSGNVPNAGGSAGTLCLGGNIGRLSQQVTNSGPYGWVSIQLDLTNIPTPVGPTSATAGTTWYFTHWYRDTWPTTTSNFSNGRTVWF